MKFSFPLACPLPLPLPLPLPPLCSPTCPGHLATVSRRRTFPRRAAPTSCAYETSGESAAAPIGSPVASPVARSHSAAKTHVAATETDSAKKIHVATTMHHTPIDLATELATASSSRHDAQSSADPCGGSQAAHRWASGRARQRAIRIADRESRPASESASLQQQSLTGLCVLHIPTTLSKVLLRGELALFIFAPKSRRPFSHSNCR